MFFEERVIKKMAKVFEGIMAPIRVTDELGNCLVPEDGAPVELPGAVMVPGFNHHMEDQYYRVLDMHPTLVLTCPDCVGVEDLMVMADVALSGLFKSSLSIGSHSDVYRRVLKQELSGGDLISQAGENQIALELSRCCIVFQIGQIEKTSAYHILGELIPLTDTDALVEIDRHLVTLVKDMEGVDGVEELCQFAQAVQETLMEEAVKTAEVGIGEVKYTLQQLGESYLEAKRAMEVGRIFSGGGSIHVFRRLMLERFLMNVPREDSMHYHSLLFNRKTAKLFNEEMVQTIEMFFRKDLNLSDTARQLFIHRNTLVYRLDKVQRQTGLDLRRFDDAVTFKILYELKRCGLEKPREIY
ncbi:MAG: helix-turn-helix domain-containing protein [Clostridia bacterium]|nr:helix-turn-helix domain-containing protein [Clostridia bacterium]